MALAWILRAATSAARTEHEVWSTVGRLLRERIRFVASEDILSKPRNRLVRAIHRNYTSLNRGGCRTTKQVNMPRHKKSGSSNLTQTQACPVGAGHTADTQHSICISQWRILITISGTAWETRPSTNAPIEEPRTRLRRTRAQPQSTPKREAHQRPA